jgi:twinkle protein
MSGFIGHIPCSFCESSDGAAKYENGNVYCFVCKKLTKEDEPLTTIKEINEIQKEKQEVLINGNYEHLLKRGLTIDTCKLYKYQTGTYYNEAVQIANYYKDGIVIAQKIRHKDKKFTWLGDSKEAGLFGSQLWGNGKRIVITEGEIDAMSMSQAMGNKWPVVSIKDGAQSASKIIKKNLNYFNNFDEIVLMFDMDEEGQKAALECAPILPIGKVKIASLPLKDANEMLVAGRVDELVNAAWRANPYRPDGILEASELYERIINRKFDSDAKYEFPLLNTLTYGIRKGEIVLITAGTGMGKTSLVRQQAYRLLEKGKKVGFISLEESVDFTALSLLGLKSKSRLHLIRELKHNQELKQHFDSLIDGKAFFYDHFGSVNEDRLIEVIRYMAIAYECDYIVLDHISMACSGNNSSEERTAIDTAMTNLRKVVEECHIGLFVISHLRRLHSDKGHEDGADVSLAHLRGSGTLGQIPNIIIAMQGNSTGDNPGLRQLKVLKNRFSGDVGLADQLDYDKNSGHLISKSFEIGDY